MPVTYTIVVGNNGPSDAPGATVQDNLPEALTGVSWTSVASGNASVVSGATGSGNTLLAQLNRQARAIQLLLP